ncbi:hypothetical protein VRB80_13235 [Erwinia aphidicola]|uniref:hypothetical protein n=1 Tax=Erwinia aphidicola TaxID=68334 RepID=UPI0030D4BD4C
MKKTAIFLLTAMTFGASAATTYTKDELNSMDASGQYPAQEAPVTKSVESISFDQCKANASSIYSQVSGSYPAKEIVNSGVLYVVKLWTNDGAIMVSCSEPDGKKVVTQSSYK